MSPALKKKQGLRLGALNVNGLNSPQKQSAIFDKLFKNECDVVILSDTRLKKVDIDNSKFMSHLECFVSDCQETLNANNRVCRSRGVGIFKNPKSEAEFKKCINNTNSNKVTIELTHPFSTDITLSGVYGPNNDNPEFFQQLVQETCSNDECSGLILGDLNVKLDPSIDCHPPQDNHAREAKQILLNDLIEDDIIVDVFRHLEPDKKEYTYMHPAQKNVKNRKRSRLDYALSSPRLLDSIVSIQHEKIMLSGIDHSALYIDLDKGTFQKARNPPFKTPNHLCKNPEYKKLIKESLKIHTCEHLISPLHQDTQDAITNYQLHNLPINVNPSALWESLLENARGVTRTFLKKRNTLLSQEKTTLTTALGEAEELFEDDDSDENFEILKKRESDLTEFNNKREDEKLLNFNVKWASKHERPSKFFFSNLKNKGCTKTITKMEIEKVLVRDPQAIKDHIQNYYKKIFSKSNCNDKIADLSNFLYEIDDNYPPQLFPQYILNDTKKIPQLTLLQKCSIEGTLSLNELKTSLMAKADKSSAGVCSFSALFVKTFWDDLKYPFYNSYLHDLKVTSLSGYARTGLISLLPKPGKDPKNVENLRPITLLSIFYKIISGGYANRLKTVLGSLINEDQKAYITGRYIGEVTKSILECMRDIENMEKEATIMLIDFSKAFDTISHNFIFSCLRSMNFGDQFIEGIQLLLNNRFSQVNNAGHLSTGFTLERGVPQGDPISAYLFIIALEFLLHKLRNHPSLKKITLSNHEEILAQAYADDLTIIIPRDANTLTSIMDIIKSFERVSGLAINVSKTVCINIGKNRNTTSFCPTLPIKFERTFKLLGIKFKQTSTETDHNFYDLTLLLEQKMAFWGRIIFTPIGRTIALKTFILSKVTHKAMVLPSPGEKWVQKTNEKICNFVFRRATLPVAFKQLNLPMNEGGLGLPCIATFWNTLKIKLLIKTSESKDPYATLFNTSLKNFGFSNFIEVAKLPPISIIKLADDLNHPFCTAAIHMFAKSAIGFPTACNFR